MCSMTKTAKEKLAAIIDVARLRAETPGTSEITHFNNSGSGLMSRATMQAISAQLARESLAGQMESAPANDAAAALYASAGRLLGTNPDEIAIVESHTRGFGAALGRLSLRSGDRILVTRAEWCGNVIALMDLAQRCGAKIEVMPVDEDGVTNVAAVKDMIDERVKILCITWCPANGGLINPAAELVALGRSVEALTIVDAAQVVGQMPVDVKELDCDVLTAPGRKYLRAPRGTGLLYVAARALDRLAPAVLDDWSGLLNDGRINLRPDARRFENADMPPSLKAGLSVAIDEAMAIGIDAIAARISLLAERVRAGLTVIRGVTCQDLGRRKSGIVSLTVEGMPAADIRAQLVRHNITVGMNGLDYTPFDMAERNLDKIIRISPHAYTTEDEVDRLLSTLEDVTVRYVQGRT